MKKRLLKLSFSLVLSAAVQACGTSPTLLDEAKTVPSERTYGILSSRSDQTAKLTVIRDQGLHGAEHVFEIHVNGTHVADLNQGEKLVINVQQGTTFVEARMNNVLMRVPPVQVETLLRSGADYFYRVGLDEGTLRLLRDQSLTKR